VAALEHARASGDQALLAESLFNMGFEADTDAEGLARYLAGKPFIEEALVIYRSLGDRAGEAGALWALHQAAEAEQDPETSERLARQTLEIARELNDPFRRGWAAFTLAVAMVRRDAGRFAAAAPLLSESLEVFVEAQDLGGIVFNVAALGVGALQSGDAARLGSWGGRTLNPRAARCSSTGLRVQIPQIGGA
jgi:hypothetical protein